MSEETAATVEAPAQQTEAAAPTTEATPPAPTQTEAPTTPTPPAAETALKQEPLALNTNQQTEQKHTPPEGSQRWNQMYWENKQFKERQKKSDEKIQTLETRLDDISSDNTDRSVQDIQRQIREAYDAGEIDKVVDLNMKAVKAMTNQSAQNQVNTPQQPEATNDPQSFQQEAKQAAFQNFVSYNPWYNQDQTKTQAAMQVDREMATDRNWQGLFETDPNAYFQELSNRVNSYEQNTSNQYSQAAFSSGVTTPAAPAQTADSNHGLAQDEIDMAMKTLGRTNEYSGKSQEEILKAYSDEKKQITKGAR